MGRVAAGVIASGAVVALLGVSANLPGVSDMRPHGCSAPPSPTSSAGSGHAHGASPQLDSAQVMAGESCNTVELVISRDSTYIPDVAGASPKDRAKAQELLDGVNDFCATRSLEEVEQDWRPGGSNPSQPTHFFNPDRYARGLDPANPKAALVFDGELAGVMFTGRPLPPLGSIPRAHIHDLSMPVEMLHVYCTPDLSEAFTPNRQLGVNKDLQPLRLRIRSMLVGPDEDQLRAVLDLVHGYADEELATVDPVEPSATGDPDPVLQAMRTGIRQSLTQLNETELRSLWGLLRSY